MDIDEYNQSMLTNLEDLDEERLLALDHLRIQKLRAKNAYNKKVKVKAFLVGDLVMKAILLIWFIELRLGKWSPNWEGVFQIHKVLRGGAYHLRDIDRHAHNRPINGKYLKRYKPSIWETYVQ